MLFLIVCFLVFVLLFRSDLSGISLVCVVMIALLFLSLRGHCYLCLFYVSALLNACFFLS